MKPPHPKLSGWPSWKRSGLHRRQVGLKLNKDAAVDAHSRAGLGAVFRDNVECLAVHEGLRWLQHLNLSRIVVEKDVS